jgi:hypothetical protein
MADRDVSAFIDTVSQQVTARVLEELREISAATPRSTCGEDAFECDGPKFECGDYAKFGVKVLLSLDGTERAHDRYRVDRQGRGTFSRVMDGMRRLKTKQPWIGIEMTIMPDLADTVLDSVRELHRLGVNQFLIGHATGAPWSRRDMQTYADQMRLLYEWYAQNRGDDLRISGFDEEPEPGGYFGCSAGRSRVSVTVNGDVTGCSRISTLDDRETRGRLGNVHVGLFEIQRRLEMTGCEALIGNCRRRGIAEAYRSRRLLRDQLRGDGEPLRAQPAPARVLGLARGHHVSGERRGTRRVSGLAPEGTPPRARAAVRPRASPRRRIPRHLRGRAGILREVRPTGPGRGGARPDGPVRRSTRRGQPDVARPRTSSRIWKA